MINLSQHMKKFLLIGFLVFVFSFGLIFQVNATISDGTEDTNFYNNLGVGFNSEIHSLAVSNNNFLFIGGWFNKFNNFTRYGLVKLNSNGIEDSTFNTNLGNGFRFKESNGSLSLPYIDVVKYTPDNQLLVGGVFNYLNGDTRNALAKIDLNGNQNTSFNNNLGIGFTNDDGTNVEFSAVEVSKISLEYNNNPKILVTGIFDKFNNNSRKSIVMLNNNGTEYSTFYNNLNTQFEKPLGGNFVPDIAVFQPDGSVLIVLNVIKPDGNLDYSKKRIVKLSNSGIKDNSFTPIIISGGLLGDTGVPSVTSIDIEGSSVIIGGQFLRVNNQPRVRLFKMNSNGILDTAFNSNLGTGFDKVVLSINQKLSGKIIVTGNFNQFNNNSRERVVVLNSNGTEDTNFYNNLGAGFNNYVWSSAVFTDQSLAIGGSFNKFNNQIRNRLVKLGCCGIPPEPPVVDLSTSNPNVDKGGYIGLTWTVTGDADSCVGTSNPNVLIWNGNKTPIGNGTQNGIGPINAETTFTLTCTGPGGQHADSQIITLNPNAPSINFYASPTSVSENNKTTTLHWSVTDADSCTASSAPNTTWNGSRTFSATEKTEDVTLISPTTFKLKCFNGTVSSEASISVGINALPNFNFNADSPIAYDSSTFITWDSVMNATSCTASSDNPLANWNGNVSINGGSKISGKLKSNTNLTLACTGAGGTTTKSVLVKVGADVSLNANPKDIAKNGGTDLTWTSSNAISCIASSVPSTSFAGPRELNSVTPEKVLNISANTTFTLTCENSTGVKSESSVLVKVTPVPTVTFTGSTNKVLPGGFVDLTLDTLDADTCIASSNPNTTWSNPNNKPVNQVYTERVSGINAKTTFVIVCNSLGGVISKEVVVDIIAEKLTFNNSKVLRDSATGQYKTTLSWVLTNMTNCTASTKNPKSGLVWGDTYINIPDSPTSNSKSNVLVTAPDTTDNTKKNEYILSCFGKNSGKPATASLFLDINDLASSGTGIPDYEEN